MAFKSRRIRQDLNRTYSGDLKSDHLKSWLLEGQISNGQVFYRPGFSFGYIDSPYHSKTRPFKIRTFLSKMAAICPDFKWLSFRISDTIKNPDHLQPNLFLTIWNLDWSEFQILTVACINVVDIFFNFNFFIQILWLNWHYCINSFVSKLYLKVFEEPLTLGLHGLRFTRLYYQNFHF